MSSSYKIHMSKAGHGVKESTEDLLVWQAGDASASTAAYLVAFLNAHAREVPAHRVRTLLVELGSDLASVPTPPSAGGGR